MTLPGGRGAACGMCGERFDSKRDERRWCAVREFVLKNPKPLVVCTDCFLELAEEEYAAPEVP